MKNFNLILLMLLSVSCSNDISSSDVNISEANINESKIKETTLETVDSNALTTEKVRKAIALAKQNKDYRFLMTSTRGMSVPGIDMTNFKTLVELCGKKYNPETGDVITSEEQRLARKKQIEFMRQYNEVMLAICQASEIDN